MKEKKIIVVGGGIVGLATALKLARKFPGAQVTVLEKEARVGRHQTANNSGVLHCGLYYKPGSMKARMAVEGVKEMTAFCRDNNVPHEICGKLVVAVDDTEVGRLKNLLERGTQNGLQGLKWLSGEEMREIEPHVAGVRAQAMSPDGTLVQDFSFVRGRNALHVLNAPSPAATASLAIGGEIADQVAAQN